MPAARLGRDFGIAFLALAFLMPGHYLPWASFQGQWVAALGAVLVVFSAARLAGQTGKSIIVPPVALLLLACAAVPVVQWMGGLLDFASDAVLASAYWVALALAVIGGTAWSQQERSDWLDRLFAALIAASGVSVALACAQWLVLDLSQLWVAAAPPGARPFANLGQPNHLALLLILGVVGTIRAYMRHALGGATASLLLAWLGLGLVMTQSRTGWLMVALLFLWWWNLRLRLPLLAAGKVCLAASLFVVAVLSWDKLNDVLLLTRLNNLGERLQAGPRALIWQTMLGAIERSPWLGYGFNQVVLGHQAVAADLEPVRRMLESAHNLALDLALWAGVPFALTLVLGVGAWLFAKVRACRDLDDWSVLAAIGAILTHAMFEFPLEHAYFLLPLGLLMGSFPQASSATPQRFIAWPLALPALAMTVLLFVIGNEYLQVEEANHRVRLALFGVGNPAGADAAPPEVWLLDGPREYHRLMLTPAREGMPKAELDWMQRVTQRYAFPPAMLRYALAAGLNGREAEAALTLRRLCSMHPPQRCDESRGAWRAAQRRWAVLDGISAP